MCTDKTDWVDTPLAQVFPIRENSKFTPCNLEWSNLQMLMSHKSCIRFTAASAGPIYFALSAIPSLPDTWYYLRIARVGTYLNKDFFVQTHCSQVGPQLGTQVPLGIFLDIWVHKRSLFSVTRRSRSDGSESLLVVNIFFRYIGG